jgi:Spermidine synthase
MGKYKFEAQGFTLVGGLAESHISFNTFPEKGIISFDFVRGGKISPSVAINIIKEEIEHIRIVKKEFNRDTGELYHDIYSSPGLKKSYVVNKGLENLKSKVGQHIEILESEQCGKASLKDKEIQVAEKEEHLNSSTGVKGGKDRNSNKEKAEIMGGGDGGVARECKPKNRGIMDGYE